MFCLWRRFGAFCSKSDDWQSGDHRRERWTTERVDDVMTSSDCRKATATLPHRAPLCSEWHMTSINNRPQMTDNAWAWLYSKQQLTSRSGEGNSSVVFNHFATSLYSRFWMKHCNKHMTLQQQLKCNRTSALTFAMNRQLSFHGLDCVSASTLRKCSSASSTVAVGGVANSVAARRRSTHDNMNTCRRT